jgi:hypothetical protein|tara:strand:+ start:180 stop:374 length:195 start_codon:yes stop_codon:yes gene_type:complete
MFFLIANIRHPLKRFNIHTRFIHQPVKQLKRPIVRLFRATRARGAEGASEGAGIIQKNFYHFIS